MSLSSSPYTQSCDHTFRRAHHRRRLFLDPPTQRQSLWPSSRRCMYVGEGDDKIIHEPLDAENYALEYYQYAIFIRWLCLCFQIQPAAQYRSDTRALQLASIPALEAAVAGWDYQFWSRLHPSRLPDDEEHMSPSLSVSLLVAGNYKLINLILTDVTVAEQTLQILPHHGALLWQR